MLLELLWKSLLLQVTLIISTILLHLIWTGDCYRQGKIHSWWGFISTIIIAGWGSQYCRFPLSQCIIMCTIRKSETTTWEYCGLWRHSYNARYPHWSSTIQINVDVIIINSQSFFYRLWCSISERSKPSCDTFNPTYSGQGIFYFLIVISNLIIHFIYLYIAKNLMFCIHSISAFDTEGSVT